MKRLVLCAVLALGVGACENGIDRAPDLRTGPWFGEFQFAAGFEGFKGAAIGSQGPVALSVNVVVEPLVNDPGQRVGWSVRAGSCGSSGPHVAGAVEHDTGLSEVFPPLREAEIVDQEGQKVGEGALRAHAALRTILDRRAEYHVSLFLLGEPGEGQGEQIACGALEPVDQGRGG